MQHALPVYPANIGALIVNGATFAVCLIVPARTITPIQKRGLFGQVHMLAAQAALVARERT